MANKSDFVNMVAAKVGRSKAEATELVDAVFDTIVKVMTDGEEVNITGFGIFRVQERKARQGVNPRTGEKIQIAAKNVPKFRPSKNLKDAVE